METGTKKTWPSDHVMIVAADAGSEIRANMEGVHECQCRDCGKVLHACTRTIRTAMNLPSRGNRPINFFCVECAAGYDVNSIEEFHDHRGGLK